MRLRSRPRRFTVDELRQSGHVSRDGAALRLRVRARDVGVLVRHGLLAAVRSTNNETFFARAEVEALSAEGIARDAVRVPAPPL